MTASLSQTVRAGRMLQLLGWATFALGIVSAAFFGSGSPEHPPGALSTVGLLLACGLYGGTCLLIGAGLKRHEPWARFSGGGLSLVSLPFFPLGTLFGLAALAYIVRGWHE
jgi:hypothetical protein